MWVLDDVISAENQSFEVLILNKMKGPVEKPVAKRRKIDLTAKVVTDAEYLKGIWEKMEKTTKKKRKKIYSV